MEPKKLTKQEFADKYGYDPRTRTSTKAPTQGAVGGSNVSTGSNQYAGTISPEEFARLESGGSSQQGRIYAADFAKMSGEPAPKSDFKPGKFVQAMEDYRPDYSGGFFSDISEGVGDVGVGVVKGLVRTVPELIQTLTPDAMWGENSLLNSESERAKAFRSATTGKTGLQKLGATGVDLASMFVPFGAAGKAASLSSRGAQGASRLASMATKGVDLAAEAPSLLQRGGKYLNEAAPFIGDSVVSGAIAGRGESPVSDVLLGALSPAAGKVISIASDALGPFAAKNMAAGIKDTLYGGNKYSTQATNEALEILAKKTPDELKGDVKYLSTVRNTLNKVLKSFIASKFGTNTKSLERFGTAVDNMAMNYMNDVKILPNDTLDWSSAIDKAIVDRKIYGSLIGDARKSIGGLTMNSDSALKSITSKLASSGLNTRGPGGRILKDIRSKIIEYAQSKNGGVGNITVKDLDGLSAYIDDAIQKSSGEGRESLQRLNIIAKDGIDDLINSIAKNNGASDVAKYIQEQNRTYSQIRDSEMLMNVLSRAKSNPFGLDSKTKTTIQHIAGGVLPSLGVALGFSGGPVTAIAGGAAGSGLSFLVGGRIGEILSKAISKRNIAKITENPSVQAFSEQRLKSLSEAQNKLSEIIKKQSMK